VSAGELPHAPAWLADLQRAFSAMLRTPLDRGSGALKATPAAYEASLRDEALGDGDLSSGDRLATYNRQYWFRLFGVLQREHRLATALVGAWTFNDLAARFLTARPPRGHDLALAVEAFDDFLAAAVGRSVPLGPGVRAVPSEALLQAVRIDQAFRVAFSAPLEEPLDGAALERVGAEALGRARLRASASLSVVKEGWALLALRKELSSAPEERPRPMPPKHARGPCWAAVYRREQKIDVVPLAPLQGRLLELLRAHPLTEALGALEAECPRAEAPALAENVRRWLAEGVRLGFWTGVET
jgi:hypothetical protein